jgi:hypothetical protein
LGADRMTCGRIPKKIRKLLNNNKIAKTSEKMKEISQEAKTGKMFSSSSRGGGGGGSSSSIFLLVYNIFLRIKLLIIRNTNVYISGIHFFLAAQIEL